MYPVEIRYRPLAGDEVRIATRSPRICEAVEELWTESTAHEAGGHDVLVFLG